MRFSQPKYRYHRFVEGLLWLCATLIGLLGFSSVFLARQVQARQDPLEGILPALLPVFCTSALWLAVHLFLQFRRSQLDPLILPVVALILNVGLTMIFRLRGLDGAWQQILRGFLPGMVALLVLLNFPILVEKIRRWAVLLCSLGLLISFATAFFGVQDETGARLALKIGPLPSLQTTEILKLTLIVCLAWFIDREGERVEGRAVSIFGQLRLPPIRYFFPGLLFVSLATLALVRMSDFGAVMILGILFLAILYAGLESRIFATIGLIGLAMATVVTIALIFTWHIPEVIQNRYLAFLDPWSSARLIVNGQPGGITIAEGPGYQIQQSIYAIVAGGLSGAGLGYGSPQFIPLGASDFIFASILEELGSIVGLALLFFYTLLVLRIFRGAIQIPRSQVFERLLLVGIGVHFFTQVFVMVGGTLNLVPLTGVTIPFLSQGGSALLINLFEIGLVLAILQRVRGQTL